MVRYIGVDVHREFAEVAVLEDGVVRSGGRVPATPEGIRILADSLAPDDEVAIEATVNTFAVAKLLEERVARVVISNPLKTRAIAEAKIKTDQIDARVLAQPLAAGFLPEVWRPSAAASGGPAHAHRPGADALQEPGAGRPAPEPRPPLPGR